MPALRLGMAPASCPEYKRTERAGKIAATVCSPRLRHTYDIQPGAQVGFARPEGLADSPPHVVSAYGVAEAFTDAQAQPRPGKTVLSHIDDQHIVACGAFPDKDPCKIGPQPQMFVLPKPLLMGHTHPNGGAKKVSG
ncbi:MAG: hypothetical protein WBE26_11380 [Phycisphaerae bacterium]